MNECYEYGGADKYILLSWILLTLAVIMILAQIFPDSNPLYTDPESKFLILIFSFQKEIQIKFLSFIKYHLKVTNTIK